MRTRWLVLLLCGLLLAGAAACGGGDDAENGENGAPGDFASFAPLIAEAAEIGDVAFFTDLIQGETHTCTEAEVAASTGPDAPPEPICLEVGHQFQAIAISNYGAPGAITTPDVLARDIGRLFDDALSDQQDDYGPGDPRLYATAMPNQAAETGRPLHTAIIAAIHDFNGIPARIMRGLDFEYADGRWVIRSETTAGFPIAVDLLEPASASLIYTDWAKY